MLKKVCVLGLILVVLVSFQAILAIKTHAIVISSCQSITSSGFYELNQSVSGSGNCIDITNSSVIFDCKGFNVQSTNSHSIISQNENNITVLNCNLSYSYQALGIGDSSNIEVRNIIAFNNTFGIDFERIVNLIVDNVTVFDCQDTDCRAFELLENNNTIVTNVISSNNNYKGFNIFDMDNFTFRNIIAENNGFITQDSLSRGITFFNDVWVRNQYVVFDNITSNNNYDDGISISWCYYCNFTDIEANDNGDFGFRSGLSFTNRFVNLDNNNNADDGLSVDNCDNCYFDNIDSIGNTDKGILLTNSNNCEVKNILINQTNGNYGFYTDDMDNSNSENIIISETSGFYGLFIRDCDNCSFDNVDFPNETSLIGTVLQTSNNVSMNNIYYLETTTARAVYFYESNGIVTNSILKSTNDQTSPDITFRCLSNSDCYAYNVSIDGDEIGVRSITNSYVQINDSDVHSVIEAGDNSRIDMYNVTDDGLYVSDSNSYVANFWNLTVFNPLNSSFLIYDYQSSLIVNITQNFTSLFLSEFNNTNNNTIQLTPHRVESGLSGYFSSTDSVSMNMDRIITLSLLRVPDVITGNFCYTGSILAMVTGSEDCNASACVWSNSTTFVNCDYGCSPNVTKFGAACANPDYEVTIWMIIVVVIAMLFILLVKRR